MNAFNNYTIHIYYIYFFNYTISVRISLQLYLAIAFICQMTKHYMHAEKMISVSSESITKATNKNIFKST